MSSTMRSILGSVLIIISTLCAALILNHYVHSWGWMDFTSNSRYTLTDGSKKILAKVSRPLKAKLFFSKETIDALGMDQLKQFYRAHAYVRDLLREYERESGGKVAFEEYDPINHSLAQEEAADLGINVQQVPGNLTFAFGLAITSDTGVKQVLPFIDAREEGLLEYKITKLIERVGQKSKKKIGIVSALPVMGDNLSPEMEKIYEVQGRQFRRKWGFVSSLELDYEVVNIETTAKSIPADVDYLMVIHPKGFQDDILYAIDQFVMRGGKLMAFVDPCAETDAPPPNPQNQYARFTHPKASDLNRLTSKWGVEMKSQRVLVDRDLLVLNQGRLVFIDFNNKGNAFNKSELITQSIEDGQSFRMIMPGALTKVEGATTEVVPLISSTSAAGTRKVDTMLSMRVQQNRDLLWKEPDPAAENEQDRDGFEPAGTTLAAAVRVTGKFQSAFPDGMPGGNKPEDKDDKGEKPAEHLKEAKEAASILVFADADFLALLPGPADFGGAYQMQQLRFTATRSLFYNAIDYLAGSQELVGIRSRGSAKKEFDYILEIRKEARKKTEDKQAEIQKEIQKFQAKLTALQEQATKDDVGRLRGKALKEKREANLMIIREQRKLNDLQRKSTEAEDAVKDAAWYLNVLGLPAFVALIGLILWFVRLNKRSQQMREDMA